jgi:serine/threonine protein kinase
MSDDPLIAKQLDEYRLEELLGQGGMARVYRGFDVRLKRWVAIKVIDTPFQAKSDYKDRFEREAQAIAQLEHPHIVSIYRYGEVDEMLYIAMQYIEGSSLDALLASYKDEGDFMPSAEIQKITRDVCRALDYAHSKGVIHRDIKPANIMLNQQGSPILADFGLALLADVGTQGEIFGTPHYIAPEQAISSAGALPQSDLYSVGVMLYEMFTNEVPFDAPDPLDVAMLHMSEEPPSPRTARPGISPELEAVILKTLAKDPQERYQTGAALSDALDRAITTRKITTSVLPAASRMSIPERVALSARPLPPMPAGVSKPAPAAPVADTSRPAPTAAGGLPITYIAGGAVALVVILAILWAVLSGGGEDKKVAALTTTPTTAAAAQPTATETVEPTATPIKQSGSITLHPESTPTPPPPTATPPPSTATPPPPTATAPPSTATSLPPTGTPLPPTNTPKPAVGILADTDRDFSGGVWEHVWSPPGAYTWNSMEFGERQYGACWYAQDYMRICRDSANPGHSADIGWRWTSTVTGRVELKVTARKKDFGGDGLLVAPLYYDSSGRLSAPEFWYLGADEEARLNESFIIEEIAVGDKIVVMMQTNNDATNDNATLHAQICQPACP